MKSLTRRSFLQGLSAAGAVSSLPAAVRAAARGANDDIRIAVVGLYHRGPQLVGWFRKVPGVRVVALCDCDTQMSGKALEQFGGAAQKPRTVVDFRRLLDAKDVDAVAVATPNHWHALMTVWACQAGKDVYVEKPVCHTIVEGRRMVRAARKHKRIVQAGTQNRSCTGLQQCLAFLREGSLGKMKLVRGYDYPGRQGIGKVDGPQRVPKTVDYNLYQGPAPLLPLRRKELHYDWHWIWDTGDGDGGNRGIHTLDQIRWFLGQRGLPEHVFSIAGRLGWDDDGQTPNTQIALFDYQPVPILWEMMTLPKRLRPPHLRGIGGSMVIECEGGYLSGWRGGGAAFDKQGKPIKRFRGDGGVTHAANFVAAVRSRKSGAQRAEILEGHLSTALCHMANISHHAGHRRSPDDIKKAVADDELLSESAGRLIEHLGTNGVDPAKTPLTLGPKLTMDTKAERFTGQAAEWANMYITRQYRRGFVLPDEA